MKTNDQFLKLEHRVSLLEKKMEERNYTKSEVSVGKRMEDLKQQNREKRKRILLSTGGILAHADIDPVKWQKKIRKEWNVRFDRETKKQ